MIKLSTKYYKAMIIVALLAFNGFIWHAERVERPRPLTVAFLDVGQGDALYVRSPRGNEMLIDAGRGVTILSELSAVMPFYDKFLNILLATHPDEDHLGGFPLILSRFKVGAIVESGFESENSLDDAVRDEAKNLEVPRLTARRGTTIDFGDGAVFEVLYPDRDIKSDANASSIVGILSYGNTTFLLTGDAPMSVEQRLVNYGDFLKADVLKAGHHGSRTSTNPGFAAAVLPAYTIVSAGRSNTYGHPHKEVIDTLLSLGTKILGTYEKGRIIFETDGKELRLK